ncbi:MAG: hypothetical protein IJX39_06530 [Clostridia bacterium]|nr:hypothetical protein [Clostridia bacterium]
MDFVNEPALLDDDRAERERPTAEGTRGKSKQLPYLISTLTAPVEAAPWRQIFRSKDDMAMIDATGLGAETVRHGEERFFHLYREAAEAARDGHLLLLCPTESDPTVYAMPRLSTSPRLILSQLCAALRASALGHVSLILPYVHTVGEIDRIRQLIDRAMRLLAGRGEPFDEAITVGILLATPASLLLSRKLLETVDFLLIDADTVTRLSVAADPHASPELMNESAAAVLRLIEVGVGNAHACGRFAAVGGQMVSDHRYLPHFLAMGADALFAPAEQIPEMRRLARTITQNSR